jgi:hypothetical protein
VDPRYKNNKQENADFNAQFNEIPAQEIIRAYPETIIIHTIC